MENTQLTNSKTNRELEAELRLLMSKKKEIIINLRKINKKDMIASENKEKSNSSQIDPQKLINQKRERERDEEYSTMENDLKKEKKLLSSVIISNKAINNNNVINNNNIKISSEIDDISDELDNKNKKVLSVVKKPNSTESFLITGNNRKIEVRKANIEENITSKKEIDNKEVKSVNNTFIHEEMKTRNKNMFGSLKNYLSKAKQTLEKDEKIKQQENIKNKISEEVKKEYDEIKDEEMKIKTSKIMDLTKSQNEIDRKILQVENELKYNMKSENIKNFSNFILTKTKPQIFWIPNTETNETRKLLDENIYQNKVLLEKMKNDLL